MSLKSPRKTRPLRGCTYSTTSTTRRVVRDKYVVSDHGRGEHDQKGRASVGLPVLPVILGKDAPEKSLRNQTFKGCTYSTTSTTLQVVQDKYVVFDHGRRAQPVGLWRKRPQVNVRFYLLTRR